MMGVRWIVFTPKGKSRPKNRHPVSMKSWSALATWSKPESGPHCLYFSIRRSTIPLSPRGPSTSPFVRAMAAMEPLMSLRIGGRRGLMATPWSDPFFPVKIQIHFLLFNIQFLRAKCSMSFWFTSAIFLNKFHSGFVKIHFFWFTSTAFFIKNPFLWIKFIKLHFSVAPVLRRGVLVGCSDPFFLREVLQGGMVSQSFVENSIRYHYKMYMRAFV